LDYAQNAPDDVSREKFLDIAQTYAQKAEKNKLDGAGGKLYRGQLELARGQLKMAQGQLELAKKDDKTKALGNQLLTEGKQQLAAGTQLLEQAAEQRPDYEPVLSALGRAYYMQNRPDAALEEFRKAVKLRPDDIAVTTLAIELLYRKGDSASWQQARDLLQQGLQIAPTDPNLARFTDLIGDPLAAIRHREDIEKSNPDDLTNIRSLALLYIRASEDAKKKKDLSGAQGYLDKAKARMQGVVTKNPKNLIDVSLLARILAIPPVLGKDPGENLDGTHAQNVLAGLKLFDAPTADESLKYDALMARGVYLSSPEVKDIRFNPGGDAGTFTGLALAAQSFSDANKLEKSSQDDAQRHLADLYFDNNMMDKAEAVYQQIYDNSPPGPPRMLVLRRLAEVTMREKKWDQSDKLIDKEILSKNPDDPQGLVLKAASLVERGKPNDAMVLLNRVLANDQNYSDALYYHALAQFRMQSDFDKVINDLLSARKNDPNNVGARKLLAATYERTCRFAEASNEYAEILKSDPQNIDIRLQYMDFLLELIRVSREIPSGATDEFSNNVKATRPRETFVDLLRDSETVFPGYPMWSTKAADAYTAIGNIPEAQARYEIFYKNVSKMLDSAQQDLQAFPQSKQDTPEFKNAAAMYMAYLDVYQQSASAYMGSLLQTKKQKDCETVVAIATKALANPYIKDPSDFYLRRSAAYFVLGRNTEGQTDLDQALSYAIQTAKEKHSYARFISIMTDIVAFTPAELLESRLKVRMDADPNDALAAVGRIHILVSLSRADEAIKVAQSVHVPPDNPELQGLVLKETGLAYYAAKDYPKAVAALSDQLKLQPGDLDSLNNVAFMMADNLHKAKEAVPYIQKALDILNKSGSPALIVSHGASLYDTSGWVKWLNGDQAGAVVDLRKSIQSVPQPMTYYHLAQVLRKTNQLTDARLAVDQGLKLAVANNDGSRGDLEQLQKDLGTK
jgi:tetratricopeptide (TPR) repeat protein